MDVVTNCQSSVPSNLCLESRAAKRVYDSIGVNNDDIRDVVKVDVRKCRE